MVQLLWFFLYITDSYFSHLHITQIFDISNQIWEVGDSSLYNVFIFEFLWHLKVIRTPLTFNGVPEF